MCVYLSSPERDFAVWKHVLGLHGMEAANRALSQLQKNPEGKGDDNHDALLSCQISPRVRNLVEPPRKALRATMEQQHVEPSVLSSLFPKPEWERLKRSFLYRHQRFLEVGEMRVNRSELEKRLLKEKEAMEDSGTLKLVVVFAFSEKSFEAVQKVGQAKYVAHLILYLKHYINVHVLVSLGFWIVGAGTSTAPKRTCLTSNSW